MIYEGDADDRGFLVTRQGQRVLTSVKLHLAFIRTRKAAHGQNYAQLIRLLKAWVKEQKRVRGDEFRCKSFLVELLVAHLLDEGWRGAATRSGRFARRARDRVRVHRLDPS